MGWLQLNPENLAAFEDRVKRLRPDTARHWGQLEPAGMLLHLKFALQLSLGEVEIPYQGNFLTRHVVRHVAFKTPLPWPKGKIKAPPEFTPAPTIPFDACQAEAITAMQRFVQTSESDPARRTLHPFFGMFTLQHWQRVHGKHFNHHFEQFGV